MNSLPRPVYAVLALLILLGALVAPVAAPALADTMNDRGDVQSDGYDWSDGHPCMNGYDWSDGHSCPGDYDWSDGD